MRRIKRDKQGTLFPFVSVLICVIGALTFLIISVGVTSSFDATLDLVQTGDPILNKKNHAEKEHEIVVARYNHYKEILNEQTKRTRELSLANNRDLLLKEMLTESRENLDSLSRISVHVERDLNETANKLEKTISASNNGNRTIILDSRWKGKSSFNPIFVECDEKGITILANGRKISVADIEESGYLNDLLQKIKGSSNWCLFLLIRSGGVHSFDKLYFMSRDAVPLGYYPIIKEGDLNVSHWPNPEWLN